MTPSFTGFQRQRTSTRRVRVGDRVAQWVVTAGGLLTIAAVLLVCLFLLWVALPLLAGASVQAAGTAPADLLAIEQAPAKAQALAEGASLRIDDAMWQRTPGQLRRQSLQVRSG